LSRTETLTLTEYCIKLIGVLATAAGSREINIKGPDRLSLSELISQLVLQVNKNQFKELLVDSATNNPMPNVIMLLNEQDCNLFDGLRTRLESGTVVTVIPVAHGG
jgi:molybdopterin converting factor small subunit